MTEKLTEISSDPKPLQTGEGKLSDIQEWVFHLDLHVTEHDLSHAGKALRSAWPQVKQYFLAELQKQKRENDCLVRVINEYGKIRQNDKKRLNFKDGAEWAEQVCRAVGRKLSQGAGYACNIAADEIKDQLHIINEEQQAPCYSEVKPLQDQPKMGSATSALATPANNAGEDQGRDEDAPRVPAQPAVSSPTPRTDAVDDKNSPDTNGDDGWKPAYFAMLTHAKGFEVELGKITREAHDWWATAYKYSDETRFNANKIAHIIKWLELNQPDVFRRGIWDKMP